MSKLSVTLLFIGVSLLVVCDGSPVSSEGSDSNESEEVNNILGEIREQCIKNTGSDAAFDGFMISLQMGMMCLTHLDERNFAIDASQLSNATRGTFFHKYCPEMRSMVSCWGEWLPGMQPCLTENAYAIAGALIDSLPEALDLACKNNGDIIMKLEDKERKECIMPNANKFWKCGDILTNGMDNVFDLFKLKQDQCSILTSFRKCINEQLEPCDLSDIVSIYDIPMNAILPLTTCANETNVANADLISCIDVSRFVRYNNSIVEN